MHNYSVLPVDFDPFLGAAIEKAVPVTESQQEIWMSCVLGGDEANLSFNETLSLSFTGQLSVPVFKTAFQELVNRHEAFRASFSTDGSRMIIYHQMEARIHYQDISLASKQSQQDYIEAFSKKATNTPFDLTDAPLLKFGLFKQADNKYFLNISTHHIVCDGWSFGIILEELSSIYNAGLNGTSLPPEPLKFSQYALDDFAFSKTAEYTAIEQYWVNKYHGNIPSFEMPTDFPRGKLRTYTCTKDDYLLSNGLANAIKKSGAKFGSTFVNTLMSAFEVLIYKTTGQTDVVLGLPTAGQAVTGHFNLIGHCVNFLPLRSHPSGNLKFSEYLHIRKTQTIDDYEHQRFTFGSLLKKINIKRDATWTPLTPVSFNIDIGMDKNVSFQGLSHELIYNAKASEVFDIFLNITESKEGYIFQWTYNKQLFRAETIKAWMDKFTFLLEQMVANPELRLDEYSIENTAQVFEKIHSLNDTFKKLPDTSVIALIEHQAILNKEAIALQFDETILTYEELNQRANQLAHFLRQKGIVAGDMVGIILDRDIHIVVSILAILKCGATYIPLDPAFPHDRIQFMIVDSGLKYCIANKGNAQKFDGVAEFMVMEDLNLSQQPIQNLQLPVSMEAAAYILYTSGSTGKPKGVIISQRNLLNFLLGMKTMLNTNEATRLLSVTTISFDIVGLELFVPLISGGRLILANSQIVKDGEEMLHVLKSLDVNLFQATPATYKMMLDNGWNEKLPLTAICGGEPLPKNLAESLLDRVEVLYNLYGPTETTIWSTATQIKKSDTQISIGKPIQNTQIYICDEKMNLLPDGAVGEIYIGGAGVAKGYLNRPELTAERFVANPFSADSHKIYRTGDLGKYTLDENIICLGRTDHQVKIRGFRIELGEIEYEILKIPQIKDAAVVVKMDHHGEQKLAAYIVGQNQDTQKVSKQEILEWRNILKEKLPPYMLPAEWIKLDAFPLTPNKKVDRNALLAVNTVEAVEKNRQGFIEPGTLDKLKKIWEQELGIEDIEPQDDFFELGGHSMVAIKVMARIQNEMGLKLPISSLFESPSLGALAQLLTSSKTKINNRVLVPIKESGTKNPIFLIHAGGLNVLLYKSLSHYLQEDQPLYGLQGLGLDGDLTHLGSIEAIATRYLTELIEHDPVGPYVIVGYSFGGIIAFEMARQLLAMGKEIKLLGVLDTNVSSMKTPESMAGRFFQTMTRQIKKLFFFTYAFSKYPKDVLQYQSLVLKKKLDPNYQDAEEEQIYDYPQEVMDAYGSAYNNYKIAPLDVLIHVYRAEKRIYFVDDPIYLGWRKFAKKGVKVHRVPGDHKTFLLAPNSQELVRILLESMK